MRALVKYAAGEGHVGIRDIPVREPGADEILILENGAICEQGARVELARDPTSRFYSLLQTGLEEVLV